MRIGEDTVTVFEVRPKVSREHQDAFFRQYGQTLGATSDNLNRECCFDIMLDRVVSVSVPNCLDFCGRKMLVKFTDRKPTCWRCGENGHLFSSCSEKKASGFLVAGDQNPPLVDIVSSASPVMGLPTTRTGAENPSVGLRPPFRRLPQVRTRRREMGNGVSFVEEEGRVEQRVLSPMMTPKDNNPYNPIPSTSSKDDAPDS